MSVARRLEFCAASPGPMPGFLFQEALQEFEGTLMVEPNRFRSLFGAAQAAELSRDTGKARALYISLSLTRDHFSISTLPRVLLAWTRTL